MRGITWRGEPGPARAAVSNQVAAGQVGTVQHWQCDMSSPNGKLVTALEGEVDVPHSLLRGRRPTEDHVSCNGQMSLKQACEHGGVRTVGRRMFIIVIHVVFLGIK